MKKNQKGPSWTSERSAMFGANVQNTPPSSSTPASSHVTSIDGVSFTEGDLLLQALNGFVLVVTAEGYVFYTSPTIQHFLGFHQSDVIHQSVFELIHTDDRALFRQQLHFAFNPTSSQQEGATDSPCEQNSAEISTGMMIYNPQTIPPENSSFLERHFCCRFRCLLDNSSGFLALNFRGRLKLVHGQNRMSEDGKLVPPQLALFTIATPVQPPSILEIRTKALIFQTKHKLDFSPLGIDTRGKVVLGYSEIELCMKGSGYNFIHAADMMYCADNHIRMIKTGESGFTVFRLLAKNGTWLWVQANARLVFKGGKPDFIVARQKALTNAEGEEQLRLRRLQLPFNFTTGEALLYDVAPAIGPPDPCSAPKQRKLDDYSVSPNSILGCMLNQDQSLYNNNNNSLNSVDDVAFKDTHATVSVPGDVWTDTMPKNITGGLMTSEATVQEMMDTLQQILGENDLTDALEVEPEELKSWESTLLKLSTSCDMSDNLNDILSNDILSYVEEQLQMDGGLKVPDQLVDVEPCLPSLDLENFSWPVEPQNQLMPNGGQMISRQMTPVLGTMKLTHMDLPQLPSSSSNGEAFQQITPQQIVPTCLQLGTTGNISVMDSCSQAQARAQDSSLGAFSLNQTPPNQNHFNQTAQPMQNNLQMRTPNLPVSLQNLEPTFNFQSNQWRANSNHPDHFVGSYPPNSSNEQGFMADPSSSSCLQGHFPVQSQKSDNQRQSWLLEHQQHMSSGQPQTCLKQMPGFQRNPLPGVVQNGVNGRSTFRNPETSSTPYHAQQDMGSSVSMFFSVTPSMPSCQRLNPVGNQLPSKPSCFYQSLPGGVTVVPDPDEAALSCKMTTGLNPEELLVQQQHYFGESHTQINSSPIIANGGFPFSALPNGNAYYSENK